MKKLFVLCAWLCVAAAGPAAAQEVETFTDSRDGHVYKCVRIGDQVWMAENLAYLPRVDRVSDGQFEQERFWVYGYFGQSVEEAKQTDAYKNYGVIYNWLAARNSCPEGWHMPTEEEWEQLEITAGMDPADAPKRGWRESGDAGRKLKARTGWKENSGEDTFGFAVLPGGMRGYNDFESVPYCAYFWTASPSNGDNGWSRSFIFDENSIERTEDRRYVGMSVRCVRDN